MNSKLRLALFALAGVASYVFAGSAQATVITSGNVALVSTGAPGPSPATPVLSTPVLDIALASNGATAYASSVLNGFTAHSIPHLNDGTYGNSNSWIGGATQNVQDPTQTTTLGQGFAGIALSGTSPYSLTSFAFGRSQTGDFNDRANGVYTVQYTTAASPTAATPDSSYVTLGTVTISGNDALRHLYSIPSPVTATGLRIIVPLTFAGDGGNSQAIDEIEILGVAVPEPGSITLFGLGALGLLLAFRRRIS